MKFLVYEESKPLVNNVALGGIQDLLVLSIGSEVFPILEIFKILYFLLFDKTPSKTVGAKHRYFRVLDGVVNKGD